MITIKKFRENTNGQTSVLGNLEYAITFNLGGQMIEMTFKDVRVMRSNSGSVFLSPPSREYTNAQGEKKYSSYFSVFDRNQNEELSKKILAALEEYKRSGSVNGNQTQYNGQHGANSHQGMQSHQLNTTAQYNQNGAVLGGYANVPPMQAYPQSQQMPNVPNNFNLF